jgi:4-amino-4-deoxy-L-arabinose transferase-like glycosyltransferase
MLVFAPEMPEAALLTRFQESEESTCAHKRPELTSKQVITAFIGIWILNLALRVFYLRYDFVNGDEAIRALTAARMLEGARLYIDVVTDKPPGTTLFYAGIFLLFGKSMSAVHIGAAVWNFLTSVVLYRLGAHFYTKRIGLLAALLFVYFTTNYFTPDMMAANTELLMVLPYSAAFLFFLKSYTTEHSGYVDPPHSKSSRSRCQLIISGVLTGAAVLFKQVGVFSLALFGLIELLDIYRNSLTDGSPKLAAAVLRSLKRLSWVCFGFAGVIAFLVLSLALTGSLKGFYRYSFEIGMFYVDSLPLNLWFRFLIGRTISYIAFNAPLWGLAVWISARALRSTSGSKQTDRVRTPISPDVAIALWGIVSLSGVVTGGRFFGHYFIQVLPALCLLAAKGVEELAARLQRPQERSMTRAAIVVLVAIFLFSFVRFHHRTCVLAYETISGTRTKWSEPWGMTLRQKEAEIVAARVLDRTSPGEPLYIWDYALDVYWLTGCPPASRFLVPYYVTGKFPEAAGTLAPHGNRFWSRTRAIFLEDLARVRPRLILDVYGNMLELPYPEVVAFLRENYEADGHIGPQPDRPFVVLRRKD